MNKPFLIRGQWCEIDGEYLYWSNVDGWVNRASATVFYSTERLRFPIGYTSIEEK